MSEFWKAIKEFEPKPRIVPEYRLYYEGTIPVLKTDEKRDGDYLVISKEQYDTLRMSRCRVIEGKIIEIDMSPKCILQLKSDINGQFFTTENNMIFATNTGDGYSLREDDEFSNNWK